MKQGKPLTLEELLERRREARERKQSRLNDLHERRTRAAKLILQGEKLSYIAAITGVGELGINRIKHKLNLPIRGKNKFLYS